MELGVFGGTFDPIHLGHLSVASDVHSTLGLDRTLIVPAAVPPHKASAGITSASLRLEMVRAAVEGDDRLEVDDRELRRPGPSYTVDTLRALAERFPGARLNFLIGADALRDLPTWRAPDEVVRLARLVVFSREGDAPIPETGVPFTKVAVARLDISATDIRARVRAGRPIRYLVPDPVREIIHRESLYR
jgi:nicotinate-nucleotide adenylyltransferase